jgi:hypothetical protein
MIDEDDCGAIGGMKIGRVNRSTRRKPAPAPLCPPQIPHDQTRARRASGKVEFLLDYSENLNEDYGKMLFFLLVHAGFFLTFFFDTEEEGDMFL